jgi:hypothetical protein
VSIEPGGLVEPVDPATGLYGPVQLVTGTYTVTAAAAGYLTATVQVTIADGLTTTQDFSLSRPAIQVSPAELGVVAPPGTPVTLSLTVSNAGHEPLHYEIVDMPGGGRAAPAQGAGRLDIPWAWAEPVSATVPPQAGLPVSVTFRCTITDAGQTLTGTLRLEHNDPCAAAIDVPLELSCVAQPVPDIELSPSSVEQTLCPGSTATATLTVCNLGTAPLDWSILELAPRPRAAAAAGQAERGADPRPAAGLPALCAPLQPAGTAPPAAAEPRADGRRPEEVFWDQPLTTGDPAAYVNQEFPEPWSAYSAWLSDDFVNTTDWPIGTLFVPGDLWNGGTSLLNATALHWQIYADAGGVPAGDPAGGGSPPVWALSLAPADPQVSITNGSSGLPSNTLLTVDWPFCLPAGHCWLVFYPTMDVVCCGEFGLQPSDTTNGAVTQWTNPGGGFGLGPGWQPGSELGETRPDMAFRIEGPLCVCVPWLTVSPGWGSLAPSSCQDVTLAFDPAGLSPGRYDTALHVASNDPDEPDIALPVTMTLPVPAGGAALDWSPPEPLVGETVALTGTVEAGDPPLTFTWAFGDGDTGSGAHASHAYAASGPDTVTLSAANGCGEAHAEQVITIRPVLPALLFVYLPVVTKGD